jgi:hypothetical protein
LKSIFLKKDNPHKKSTIGIVIEKYPNVALTRNLEKCAPVTPSQFCMSIFESKDVKKSEKYESERFASSLLSKVITLKKSIIEIIRRNNPSICFLLSGVKIK